MVRLSVPKEPYWMDLPHGVRVFVRPCSTAIYEAARAKGQRLVTSLLADHAEITLAGGSVEGLPDLDDADARDGLSQYLFTRALATAAIIAWSGVQRADGSGPAEVTEQTVADLMRIHTFAESFLIAYTQPLAEATMEGNVSGPSPSGTSGEGPRTARGAETSDCPAPMVD